jgi:inner membrane protein involved in colicin E2 resistance
MKRLKQLIPNDLVRYCVIGIALLLVFLLSLPFGEMIGRQLYRLTH